MGFDFSVMMESFNSPIVLGLIAFVILGILGGLTFFIVRNVRGGFGRMSRPKDVFQRCFCVTPSNNLVFYKLKVKDEYVEDESNMACHFLYSDALLPEKKTGVMWLPVVAQQSTPLYPFDEDLQKRRNKYAEDNIKQIAIKEDSKANMVAQYEAVKSVSAEMQKFGLVASFVILLLIILGVMITKLL